MFSLLSSRFALAPHPFFSTAARSFSLLSSNQNCPPSDLHAPWFASELTRVFRSSASSPPRLFSGSLVDLLPLPTTTMVSCFQMEAPRAEDTEESCVVEVPEEARQREQIAGASGDRRTPVLLFDVMGTIVRDPFYDDIPTFFGLTMKELLACKHPSAWVEFEKGLITEEELVTNFFSDGREFDFEGLKACVARGYTYLEGVEAILHSLKTAGYQMHAFTNYPSWYTIIEDKLKLSKYLSWTFVSCQTGRRKPDPKAYVEATEHLRLKPSDCVFIDDQQIKEWNWYLWSLHQMRGHLLLFSCGFRPRNVDVASSIGMAGILFQGAPMLEKDLLTLGIHLRRRDDLIYPH